jgi:GTPase
MGFLNKLFGKEEPGKVTRSVEAQVSMGATSDSALLKIEGIYFIVGVGLIVVGSVQQGTLKPNQKANVNGKQTRIKSIEANHAQLQKATIGQKVGISLESLGKDDVKEGQIISFRD